MNFKEELEQKVNRIEKILKEYLPIEEGFQRSVIEAMNYSALAGGKRLRPMMMAETYSMLLGEGRLVEPFMAALEMIHTYSLVHDDLPAMDNDDMRRGRKTTHIVYGEAIAILAGDGLLNFAFETAAKAFDMEECSSLEDYKRVAKAIQILGRKAGIYGMIGGQTLDIESEEKEEPITPEEILYIHENKTAALIQAAMMVGGVLAGASEEELTKLEQCAYKIGIAFQIQDDILDVIGDSNTLGKPVGSDAKNQKQTYVSIYGLEKAKEDVKRLSEEATAILSGLRRKESDTFLEQLVQDLIYRTK